MKYLHRWEHFVRASAFKKLFDDLREEDVWEIKRYRILHEQYQPMFKLLCDISVFASKRICKNPRLYLYVLKESFCLTDVLSKDATKNITQEYVTKDITEVYVWV